MKLLGLPWGIRWKLGACLLLLAAAPRCADETLDRIPPSGAVDGYVCHGSRDELAVGVEIVGRGVDGVIRTTSSGTGYFLLEGLATGPQSLLVTGTDFSEEMVVTVVADETTRLPEPACLVVGTGAVQGRICASETGVGSGEGYWLAGASVWVDVCTPDCIATTDADGAFFVDGIPEGPHLLKVKKGSFSTTVQIDVVEDQTADVTHVCVEPTTRLTVVTGLFDSIEEVLGGLGFAVGQCLPEEPCLGATPGGNVTLVNGENSDYIDYLLLDSLALAQVDILFFNCGLADAYLASAPLEAFENLRDFVDAGGSIYASDWAYEVLSAAFDGLIRFAEDDGSPTASRVGLAAPSLASAVIDTTLRAVLGKDSVTLVYDKSAWVPLDAVQGTTVETWVSADVSLDIDGDLAADEAIVASPLLVSVPYGQGNIVFTTFHTHAQVSDDMTAILRHIVFEL